MMHPARTKSFDDIWDNLLIHEEEGFVRRTEEGNLTLWCYTEACTYDDAWDEYLMMARGLIMCAPDKKIVATPFPEFFNLGEREQSVPSSSFEVFEKMDGSLIILYYYDGKWRTATKGSFKSDQAKWAAKYIEKFDLDKLTKGTTYLCEAIYPDNRIVVKYDKVGLFLLGAYTDFGLELQYPVLESLGNTIGWPTARRTTHYSISTLVDLAKDLPVSEEGWVIKFFNGHRLKVKGAEYCRIHALISDLTPLAVWNAMLAGGDLSATRKQLPEEFWSDFDQIVLLIQQKLYFIISDVVREAKKASNLTDKELGMRLTEYQEPVRTLIFPYRKGNGDLLTGRTREKLFKFVRPDGNRLTGYMPSFGMRRVMQEAV